MYDDDVAKIVVLIGVSQQMVDEADAVAKSEGWDTLMSDIAQMLRTSWDRANTAIMSGDPL